MNLIFYHNCYRPKWWQPFLRGNNNYYSTNVIPCNFYLAECTEPEKWEKNPLEPHQMGIFWRSVKNSVHFPCNFQDTKRAASVCFSTTCGFLSAVRGGFENEIQCATESIEWHYCIGDFSKWRYLKCQKFVTFLSHDLKKCDKNDY